MKFSKSLKKTVLLIGLAILVVLGLTYLAKQKDRGFKQGTITTYEECEKAEESVIQESYPQVCVTKSGQRFVQPTTTTPAPPEPTNQDGQTENDCIITGCSGQICAGEEVVTTCEYKEEYACYDNATCERQENGECSWTMTNQLSECLLQNQNIEEPYL